MHKVTLLFGSNLGNSLAIINDAIIEMEQLTGREISRSSTYLSPSWGFESKNIFFNVVSVIETILNPESILDTIDKVEKKAGRIRGSNQYADRSLDIDIIFYDSEIINNAALTIPHPHIAERRFALLPLSELMPEFKHPVCRKTILQMLNECTDYSIVKKI